MTTEEREEYFEHQLALHEEKLRPAGIKQVAKMLTVMASVMQLGDGKVPQKDVLIKYYDILKEYPVDLLDMAMNEYIRTCTYNKFPLIADLTTQMDELWNMRKKARRDTKRTRDDYRFPGPTTCSGHSNDERSRRGPRHISSLDVVRSAGEAGID